MNAWSAWNRLLQAVVKNEPVLPGLRPHLVQLKRWILEAQEEAPRVLRRHRALRPDRRSAQRACRPSRAARRAS